MKKNPDNRNGGVRHREGAVVTGDCDDNEDRDGEAGDRDRRS